MDVANFRPHKELLFSLCPKLSSHEVEDVFCELNAVADAGDYPGRTGGDVFSREPDGRDDRSGNDHCRAVAVFGGFWAVGLEYGKGPRKNARPGTAGCPGNGCIGRLRWG